MEINICIKTVVSDLWNDTSLQDFARLQTLTINVFMWNPAICKEYRWFLEKAYKRFL